MCKGRVVFFNETATTEIYTLSRHDALPICNRRLRQHEGALRAERQPGHCLSAVRGDPRDRKRTRLHSSHAHLSYAVFCLKKNFAHLLPRLTYTCRSLLPVSSLPDPCLFLPA